MPGLDLKLYIPPAARTILEYGSQASRIYTQRIHPGSHWLQGEDGKVPAVRCDCLLYGAGIAAAAGNLAVFARQISMLADGGQVVCDVQNSRYLCGIFREWPGCREFLLQDILAVLQQSGIRVFEIRPYFEQSIKEVMQQPEIQAAVRLLAEKFSAGGQPEETKWQAGWIIRGIRGELPRRLSIQAIMGETLVCSRVRLQEPHAFCRTVPGIRIVEQPAQQMTAIEPAPADGDGVVIRQRISLQRQELPAYLQGIRSHRLLSVAEFDDDPHHWPVYEETGFLTFRACHAVQVSTEPLAAFLREFNPHVRVFANQMRFLPPPRSYQDERIVLFFGALNREADWQPLLPALNAILEHYADRLLLRVVYDQQFFAALATKNKEFFPFLPYERYLQVLRSADIAILPLGDTPFNRMKSDLKYIESAACGAAVLASPTVYADTIIDGSTGFIFDCPERFALLLSRLIADPVLRRKAAQHAYCYVAQERMLYQHYAKRLDWYRELCAKLPELDAELMQRLREAKEIV